MKKRAFIVKRFDGSYIPFDDMSQVALNKIDSDECIEVKISNIRLLWYHRRFFLALKFIHENLSEEYLKIYPTQESLRKVLLILSGHIDIIEMPDGSIQKQARSINFETVNQDDFEQIYSTFIDVALEYFITDEETQRKLIDLT